VPLRTPATIIENLIEIP